MPDYLFKENGDGVSYDEANDITLIIDSSAGDRAKWKIHLKGKGVPTDTKESTSFFNALLGENDIYIPHASESTQKELAKIITAGLAPFKYTEADISIRLMGKFGDGVILERGGPAGGAGYDGTVKGYARR